MTVIILVIHIFLAIALIAVIMLQKSEGGALGIGGGGGMSGFMTGRSTANLLTRTTAGIAVAFFLTSIALAIFADRGHISRSVVDQGPIPAPTAPAPAINPKPVPAKPAAPAAPSAPLAK